MKILPPLTITDANFGAGTTIAEPAAGETLWVSGTFALGAKVIRTTTHRVYECVQAHSARATFPENDPTFWQDIGPTQRYAPFDFYRSTAATTTTSLTYQLNVGIFNTVALYGLVGSSVTILIKATPGGTVIHNQTYSLLEDPPNWYEYLFSSLLQKDKLIVQNLPIRNTAELTLTVAASTGATVSLGLFNIGNIIPLYIEGSVGAGVEWGATAEPTTYSFIKTLDDGTLTIVRRHKATNMRCRVTMPKASADYALDIFQRYLDIPVSWIGVDVEGYSGLSPFGLGSGELIYENFSTSKFQITVKGLV
jgi:hypothetical protein